MQTTFGEIPDGKLFHIYVNGECRTYTKGSPISTGNATLCGDPDIGKPQYPEFSDDTVVFIDRRL
jgi:hypothetical protein